VICFLALFGYIATSSVILARVDDSKRALTYTERDVESISLEKRKGGGGGHGSGGKGGSSGSSGESSSGGSKGGSAPNSNSGGTSKGGSGVRPTYSGGRYYGGGAAVPYAAGQRTPNGLVPIGLLGIGALAFFPGAWLYGAYLYNSNPYTFHNDSSGNNETKPVDCLCQEYSVCGCDNNTDPTYMNSVIGNGDVSTLNQSLVRVADVNGTSTIFINGTLPNGTTANAAMSLKGHSALGSVVIAFSFACAFLMI